MKKEGGYTDMCSLSDEIGNLFRGLRSHAIIPSTGDYVCFAPPHAYQVKAVIHTIDYDTDGEYLVTDVIVEKTNIAHLM